MEIKGDCKLSSIICMFGVTVKTSFEAIFKWCLMYLVVQ